MTERDAVIQRAREQAEALITIGSDIRAISTTSQ